MYKISVLALELGAVFYALFNVFYKIAHFLFMFQFFFQNLG